MKEYYPWITGDEYEQASLMDLMRDDPLYFLVATVIIAPLLEEGMFRTLIKPTLSQAAFFLTAWIIFLGRSFIPADVHWMIANGFLLVLGIFLWMALKELLNTPFVHRQLAFLNRGYVAMWMVTSLLFGLIHVMNYVEGFELNLVLFLLIFPRIVAGYFFGKIKILNQSMVWPMALHAMNNGVVFLILLPRILSS
ncbi:hypothetical protein GCM10009117_10170 [Gangjinia marincola]|uniref:CAAX prenyl protease 2/Lysostaphin resistance protein A-like domain-containing protein n=1 Tax=Gangjinia marincola TaxID=578463 RepID=A0ABP3XRB0_9FLAO